MVWHLTEDKRLGSEAIKTFGKTEEGGTEVVIPTIVLAEALYISKKYEASFSQLLEKVKEGTN